MTRYKEVRRLVSLFGSLVHHKQSFQSLWSALSNALKTRTYFIVSFPRPSLISIRSARIYHLQSVSASQSSSFKLSNTHRPPITIASKYPCTNSLTTFQSHKMSLKTTKIYSRGHDPVTPAYCENFKPDTNGVLSCSFESEQTTRFTIPCGPWQRKSVEQMQMLENIELKEMSINAGREWARRLAVLDEGIKGRSGASQYIWKDRLLALNFDEFLSAILLVISYIFLPRISSQ